MEEFRFFKDYIWAAASVVLAVLKLLINLSQSEEGSLLILEN